MKLSMNIIQLEITPVLYLISYHQ